VFVRPKEGFWGNPPIWAPEVHKLDGAYCMFATFTGRDAGRGSQILRSESPEGPLVVFHRMKNGKLVIIWSSFVKGHGYGMGQAISESGTIAGPWRHMEKPFFGGGGEDGGYGMILYHLYKIDGHNKFIRVNWMSEKTTFQARKA
jgi:GH43 family beta-xylosidase